MPKTDQPDKDHPVVYLPPTDSLDKAKLLFDSDAITVQGNNETFKRLTGEFGPSEGDTEGFTFFVKPEAGQRIIATTELWSQDDLEKGIKDARWGDNRHDRACGEMDTAKQPSQ